MKLLVTGGAGFIGTNFIYYMREKYPDYKIVNVDALTYCGRRENLSSLEQDKNYRFVQGKIEDEAFIWKLFEEEQFDMVVNFAAETFVDRSLKNPGVFLTSNVMGTYSLLEAAVKHGVKRFHQVSTDEVYGDLEIEDIDSFFTEESPIRPSSPYSASKAGADMLVLSYYRSFGLPVTISRCSNNYGPYQYSEKLIPLIICRAMNNESVPVYGDGKNVRDWLYVEDHCRAIDLILHYGNPGEVYNVGGHNEHSNLEIVKMLLTTLDKPLELITFVEDRKGHDKRYAINPEKIEKELGWKSSYSFGEGLERTINYYLQGKKL